MEAIEKQKSETVIAEIKAKGWDYGNFISKDEAYNYAFDFDVQYDTPVFTELGWIMGYKEFDDSPPTNTETQQMELVYYSPSGSYEFFDGNDFYNASGSKLRSPEQYNPHSEGYTPFGDE